MSFLRRTTPLVLAALLAACGPGAIMREGVSVPYERAAEQDLQRAREQYKEGDLPGAQQTLEQFLIELPESRRTDQALFLLGEVYEAQGDGERAAIAWRRLLREHGKSPLAPQAALRAAQSYRAQNRPELARRILEQAPFERAPEALRAQLYRLLADLARETGDYPEAVRALALNRRDLVDAEAAREVDLEIEELIQDRLRDSELEAVADELPRGPVYDRVLLELASRQLSRGEFSEALATLERLPQRLRQVDEFERQSLLVRARRGAETSVYPIGLALPLSGPYALFGQQALRGAVLSFELFADPPGRYRLIVRDTGGDPQRAGRVITELIGEGAKVVIGPMSSSVAAASVPYAERARVPLLTFAKREDVPRLGPHVFRLGLAPADQVPLLAEYAASAGETRRFAVLYPRDAQGIAFKNLFWDEMERRGGTIVGVESYATDAVDFQAEIRRLIGLYYVTEEEQELIDERDKMLERPADHQEKLAEPLYQELPPFVDFDALFIPDVAERVALILPQLRFYDVSDAIVLGPNDWNDPRLIEIAGRDARGAVFAGAFHSESVDPMVREFVDRFYSAYARPPDLWAATGYDAAELIRTTVARVGHPSSDELRKRLLDASTFHGVSGLTGFDEDGVPRRRLQLLEIKREKIVPVVDRP